ncbi:hypothetical protein FB451DRAFT_1061778 [Mycena latifolia]|nr:hypothetical protein FB451DRAFT_1061778 [Mycena latifolia]
MERYCGFLKAGLRSKRFPWANLTNRVLNYARLEQIGHRYDLADELTIYGRRSSGPSQAEKVYADCERIYIFALRSTHIFTRPTHNSSNTLSQSVHTRRSASKESCWVFSSVLSKPATRFLPLLPQIMPSWGKVRIVDGDSIRSHSAAGKGTSPERNSLYIRVSNTISSTTWVTQLFYGRLEQILVCALPKDHIFGGFSGKTRLLAVITPCSTAGKDATKEIVAYNRIAAMIVTDVQTVSAVVGRIRTREQWTIVDRSGGLVKPEFVPSAELIDEGTQDALDED